MSTDSIEKRYANLAETSCCLSCGGAVNHSEPQIGEVCLDLGSGRGNDVLRLADIVGESGFVYGQDITDAMIQKAEKTASKFGVKNVKFLKSKLEEIPLDTSSVNLVISNCTINHATDKKGVWSEIFRVLKDGGRFVVSDIYSLQPVPEEYANDPEAIAECWAGSVTRDEYLDTLENCGFEDITIKEESVPYDKGKIQVSSFTIQGIKPKKKCCL